MEWSKWTEVQSDTANLWLSPYHHHKGDYQDQSEHNMKTSCHAHVMLLSMRISVILVIPEFHGEHLVLIFIVQCCIPSGELKEVGQTTVWQGNFKTFSLIDSADRAGDHDLMGSWHINCKCTEMHPIIVMSCQISNVQASAVYTATDVLLHHHRKCITKYVMCYCITTENVLLSMSLQKNKTVVLQILSFPC